VFSSDLYGEEVATKELVEKAIEQIKEKRYYEKYGKKDVSLLGMEPECSLPCSQEPSIGPYPESDQSNPYHPILSLKDPF
jgi:hypothetical protein